MSETFKLKPKSRWPKELGSLIDYAYTLKQEVSKAKKIQEAEIAKLQSTKQLKKLTLSFKELEEYIFEDVSKSELEAASGEVAKASFRRTEHFNCVDPKKFFTWLFKTKETDVLTIRMNGQALRARREDKKKLPTGIDVFTDTKLSLTKK